MELKHGEIGTEGMTNYQFKYLMELKEKCFALEAKNEAIYSLVQKAADEGKKLEDVLAEIEALMKD